jgi:folate-dependent phosphoribosylglycinamide formyltransferase PurN
VDAVGAMVHQVVKEVDRGELVMVREVEIRKGVVVGSV